MGVASAGVSTKASVARVVAIKDVDVIISMSCPRLNVCKILTERMELTALAMGCLQLLFEIEDPFPTSALPSIHSRAFASVLSHAPGKRNKHQEEEDERNGKGGIHVHLPCRRHRTSDVLILQRTENEIQPTLSLSHSLALACALVPFSSIKISFSSGFSIPFQIQVHHPTDRKAME